MDIAVTLIARAGAAGELAALADAVREILPGSRTGRLSEGEAVDIVGSAGDIGLPAWRARLTALAAGAPIDVVVQPATGRRKKLLVADMDSTMIGQECIDELADFVGVKARVAAITERAMLGEISFEPALRERVGLLTGLPEATIDQVIAERIRLTPNARTLVATMSANGAHTALVSGGFTAFTERVAAAIGFHEHRANVLVIDDGQLTGGVVEPILGQDAKLATLRDLARRLGLALDETMAVGDGANDLAMIQAAGLGVAYHAKPKIAAAAAARIDHADLAALLYVQGFRRDEFIETPDVAI